MRTGTHTTAGYTLLEVMISMLILAIAFLALIAVQLGALNGYVSARDNTEATELAERTADLLRVEGLQWADDSGAYQANATQSAYGTSGDLGDPPFDQTNTISAILGAAGAWIPLVNQPVDVRFNRRGISDGAAHLGGKFCIYARGNPLGGELGVTVLQMQVAVVYPGPNADLQACANGNVIGALATVGGTVTNPEPALELVGLRVVYHGTVIIQR